MARYNKTHGMTHTRFYKIWESIQRRCNNPKQQDYKYYGGKGIKSSWEKFESFRDDMYEKYLRFELIEGTETASIERIDNNKGYCKENCTFILRKFQSENRSMNKMHTIGGVTKSIHGWAKYYEINCSNAHSRIRRGWPIFKAVTYGSMWAYPLCNEMH